jgi:cysteine desulfurase/selenocysteine lyase
MAIDVQKIRADFPELNRKVYGKPLIYFDNGATTLKPAAVIDRVNDYYARGNANVHRGVHFISQEATTAMENAREYVRDFLGAATEREIIFTKGTTESINLAAFSFGERFVSSGDNIIVSEMEHHANIVPWQMLCERKNAKLKVIPVNDSGELDLDAFESLIDDRTRIVAVTHISNALGTINPVKEITDIAHERNIPVLIDGAQGIAHGRVNVKETGCDFYVFSGHKIFAPMGIGILYGKEELLDKMPPWQTGGEMIDKVSFEKTTFNKLPFKFEAGTPDVGGILGLETALRYFDKTGIDNIVAYEKELTDYALEKLSSFPRVRLIGNAKHRASVISFVIEGIHHYDAGTILDKLGVAVRTGHHCAQPVMKRFGVEGTIRISLSVYNTKEEIDIFAEALQRVIKMFG